MKEIIYVYTTETYKSKNWYKIGMTNQGSSIRKLFFSWFDFWMIHNCNKGDLDVDFSNYSVEQFLKEIMKLKN